VGINISGGPVNAIEICVEVLDMPTPIEWLDIFDNALDRIGKTYEQLESFRKKLKA
jgi:hypothetical protein